MTALDPDRYTIKILILLEVRLSRLGGVLFNYHYADNHKEYQDPSYDLDSETRYQIPSYDLVGSFRFRDKTVVVMNNKPDSAIEIIV